MGVPIFFSGLAQAFAGFAPVFTEIGGWCIEDKMKEHHRHSEYDRHPGKEGHEFIAELLSDA